METKYPGVLSLITFTSSEYKTFLDYMEKWKPGINIRYLAEVFPVSDILMFFDVFSGSNIKVPSRDEMEKTIMYIKIYNYCKYNGFTDLAYENASKLFGRRVNSIKRVVEKIQTRLDSVGDLEDNNGQGETEEGLGLESDD